MRLTHIALEGFSVAFANADSELLEEMQMLLRNAGCTIPEISGEMDLSLTAAIATFCAVHNIVAFTINPRLARELLEYREQLDG